MVSISEIVLAPPSAEVKCRDPDDQKFLDCATGGRADFLVTGDRDLLEMKRLGRTRIVTAGELVRLFKKSHFGSGRGVGTFTAEDQMKGTIRRTRRNLQKTKGLEDLAGIDAGKMTVEEMKKRLDRMRSEDRY